MSFFSRTQSETNRALHGIAYIGPYPTNRTLTGSFQERNLIGSLKIFQTQLFPGHQRHASPSHIEINKRKDTTETFTIDRNMMKTIFHQLFGPGM